MVIYWILFRFLPIRLLCVICYIVFTSFSFSTLFKLFFYRLCSYSKTGVLQLLHEVSYLSLLILIFGTHSGFGS